VDSRGQSKNSWTVPPLLLCFDAQMLEKLKFYKKRTEWIYCHYECKKIRGQFWVVVDSRGQSKNSWTVPPLLLCFDAQMLKKLKFYKKRIEWIYCHYECKKIRGQFWVVQKFVDSRGQSKNSWTVAPLLI